ncbi:heparinase [Erythrobacteraceae bacterium CFH 75059]|nr:heparinase [Erythrobacteraceae bacterium CFH 75059]
MPVQTALPLRPGTQDSHLVEPVSRLPVTGTAAALPEDGGRALAVADLAPPRARPLDALTRFAYRLGVPGHLLDAPFSARQAPRLLAEVRTPLTGDRTAGVALRAGYFRVAGIKAPLGQVDIGPASRLTPPFLRAIHGFGWLRDLASCASREQCRDTASDLFARWLSLNAQPGRGPAWDVELTAHRQLNWLLFASLLTSERDPERADRLFAELDRTAGWLDRHVRSAGDKLGEMAGWCALVATGLLMSGGRPRRLYAEAGLLAALGELVGEDGGVLSRSPLAQMDAIALLVDLRACYEAVGRDAPDMLGRMLALLVPPLLTLRHGDGGLGSWQGAPAIADEQLSQLVGASGVRTRPLKDSRPWGYHRVQAQGTVLQFDAAPPPRPQHARSGCASTLAFELSSGAHRLIVNCGGAAAAGGATPVRIEQGLRATAAHSTLVLDEANSTAVLIKGQLGKGVEQVAVSRGVLKQKGRGGVQIEASHDGYAARFGLLHHRVLVLSDDGTELRGEDVLVPATRRGKRGKIGFAIRFHLGPAIAATLSQDARGASLVSPDGALWQFRMGAAEEELALHLEDSLWIDGGGRPRATQQIVVTGLTSRSGGAFPWLLKRMM